MLLTIMWEKRKLKYNPEFISREFVIRAGAHGQSHVCRHGFGEAEPGDSSTSVRVCGGSLCHCKSKLRDVFLLLFHCSEFIFLEGLL